MSDQYIFKPPPPPPSASRHSQSDYGSSNYMRGGYGNRGRGRGGFESQMDRPLPSGSFVNPNFTQFGPQADRGRDDTRQRPHDYRRNQTDARSTSSEQLQHNDYSTPSRTAAGHKRKLEALRGPNQTSKNVRSGPETAPSVPAFGSAISTPITNNTALSIAKKEQPQPRRSLFGLNANKDGISSDESESDKDADDDADEESMYAQLGNKLVFEYEGNVVKLNSEADLAKWQEERRRRYPTNARISEKEQERRRTGEERKRLLAGAYALRNPAYKARLSTLGHDRYVQNRKSAAIYGKPDLESTKSPTLNEAIQSGAIENSVSVKIEDDKTVTAKALPGMAMYSSEDDSDGPDEESSKPAADERKIEAERSTTAGERSTHVDEPQEQARSMDGISPSEKVAIAKAEDNDPDEAPEEFSSTAPIVANTETTRSACKYFFNTGRCKAGDSCDFSHIALPDQPLQIRQQPVRAGRRREGGRRTATEGRKGIHQLLMDQENAAADKLALQAIKYLGSIGFFNA